MDFSTLPEALAYYSKHAPYKTCLIEAESGDSRTYSQFWNQALFFGKRLRDIGLPKGGRVVVRVAQNIDTLVAAFGTYMAGGIYVPIAQKIGNRRIVELLQHFEASVFVAKDPVGYDCEFIDIATVSDCPTSGYEGDIVLPNPDDVSDIFFTTGTTGTPKGVMRTFGGYCAAVDCYAGSDVDVFMSCNSQNLVGGINTLRRSFLIGAVSVIGSGVVFLKDFFGAIEKYGVTALSLRPADLSMMLSAEDDVKRYCGNVQSITLKAAATSVRDQNKIKGLLPNTHIYLYYGATEALAICIYDIKDDDVRPLCVGLPPSGTEVRIVDENDATIEDSSYANPGRIACKTATVVKGYWKNPELTDGILKDGWLLMTDIGYIEDGFLYIMGRRDDVINSGGNKIAPGELEDITLELGDIEECACIPVPDTLLGSVPKLFVVMKKDAEFSAKKIYDHLSTRLESYKLPRTIESIDVLPRTEENLKVKKRSLN
jgi:long-chain acyl-CoA synthetase